ncbi:MAG: exosortase/archaeosortase family protein [bacterium]
MGPSSLARTRVLFLGYLVLVVALFHRTIAELIALVRGSDLYSHMALVPLISLYLLRTERAKAPMADARQGRGTGLALLLVATLAWGASACAGDALYPVDRTALNAFAFVTSILAGYAGFLGIKRVRCFLFPLLFLYFLVPMPVAVEHAVNVFFQHWSGLATDALLRLTGTPVYRVGMILQLPGLSIEVAEECSGIRSSVVLFMTSLLAAHMFLKSPWRKAVLVASVVPIAILRNAARITTISLMTIHVNPDMIHGPLHRQGGTPFFVLSLVPLFIILWLLRRAERKSNAIASQ